MTFRIIGVMDFVHRSEFQVVENTILPKVDLFPSSGDWRKTFALRLALSKGHNRVDVFLPSPEDGK
jgi:hypothetical protein